MKFQVLGKIRGFPEVHESDLERRIPKNTFKRIDKGGVCVCAHACVLVTKPSFKHCYIFISCSLQPCYQDPRDRQRNKRGIWTQQCGRAVHVLPHHPTVPPRGSGGDLAMIGNQKRTEQAPEWREISNIYRKLSWAPDKSHPLSNAAVVRSVCLWGQTASRASLLLSRDLGHLGNTYVSAPLSVKHRIVNSKYLLYCGVDFMVEVAISAFGHTEWMYLENAHYSYN